MEIDADDDIEVEFVSPKNRDEEKKCSQSQEGAGFAYRNHFFPFPIGV
jgi:hypothetical protein